MKMTPCKKKDIYNNDEKLVWELFRFGIDRVRTFRLGFDLGWNLAPLENVGIPLFLTQLT